ncbi:hypothetical protein T440DRAFT_520909 [Plenodomus tracheiphilus IPT5]|uniref:Response regulatory domain-containing protein n=1 Tax=Plenodomus tracheiphilus IPT5 TaxID=1408161 RepID=A0A6A7AY86_9PLEO|nr:hypothetical protein T440DRAFT_520909 [Plenodomus tracheiphilus IPT5]
MSGIKSRLHQARQKLLRRGSATSTATRSIASSAGSERERQTHMAGSSLRKSMSLSKLPAVSDAEVLGDSGPDARLTRSDVLATAAPAEPGATHGINAPDKTADDKTTISNISSPPTAPTAADNEDNTHTHTRPVCPELTLEEPTPIHPPPPPPPAPSTAATAAAAAAAPSPSHSPSSGGGGGGGSSSIRTHPSPLSTSTSAEATPPTDAHSAHVKITRTLHAPDTPQSAPATGPSPAADDYFGAVPAHPSIRTMHRKIWVKRPGASATLVQIREDDLVDDVREMILKKYANSLGRSFDSPDVTLKVVPRDAQRGQDRTLGPEEEMCRTLDAYFPGGQNVTEALIIDVPQKRTPKPSPRVPLYYPYHDDATNHQTEYFPPMPVINPSPAAPGSSPNEARIPLPHAPHSIAVLNTGQLPALPSPGGTRRGPLHSHRPKYQRTHTASPTIMAGGIASSAATSAPRPVNRPRKDSSASETKLSATSNNPIPTPPVAPDAIARQQTLQTSTPSTPRVASPILKEKRRKKRQPLESPSLPAGLLDGSVPPINVLIVEDNIINLRVLGAFMQRLKVRWQRAMNGKEAVTKWKAGGFHLVLMDIQLPVMNGLEATKEIRRLERVNSIGVFSSGSSEAPNNRLGDNGKVQEEVVADDQLSDKNMFKSPVIIVALTASSLQSDRHEALAAGCNDFLTKPVNFVWLERKVKEWGCMQALIDFDGWRKWKDFADKSDNNDSTSKLSVSYHSIAPSKKSNMSPTTASHPELNAKEEKDRKKRKSLSVVPPPVVTEEAESPPVGENGA